MGDADQVSSRQLVRAAGEGFSHEVQKQPGAGSNWIAQARPPYNQRQIFQHDKLPAKEGAEDQSC